MFFDQELGVTDDVDEQDVSDFKAELVVGFGVILSRSLYRCCLFAEFLEARIIPERIEHRIEPEQRGSERHVCSQRASARYRE